MFLDFHRTSVGAFVITADVVGSMGERAHVQVGRFHNNAESAICSARNIKRTKGYRYVVVRNRNNGWQFTVAV